MYHGKSTSQTSVGPALSGEQRSPTAGRNKDSAPARKAAEKEKAESLKHSVSCKEVQPQVSKEEVLRPLQPHKWQLKLSCLYVAFVLLGFATGTLGPTLVDLEELYNIDTATLSIVFTVGGLGYLGGSLLCGFVYDFFNYEAQFTIGMLLMGVATAAMPWPDNYAGYVGLNAVEQAAGGFIDAGGQAYILYQVRGHRLCDAFMQGSQAAWSVGITIAPLVIQPFLRGKSETPIANSSVISNLNSTYQGVSNATSARPYLYEGTSAAHNVSTVVGGDVACRACNATGGEAAETRVRYGYLLVGCIICFFSFCFCVVMLLEPSFFCLQKSHRKRQAAHARPCINSVRRVYFVVSLVVLFLWFFSQCWVETTLGSFCATFAIKRLGWTRQAGAWVTSGMWGAELAGRLASVPLAAFLKPRTMVYGSVVGTAIGCGLTLALATVHDAFYWLGVILAGIALSSSFGSAILWSANYIPITGVAASVFLVGSSVGSTVGPALVGLTFDVYGPMCVLYIVFAGSILQIGATLAYELVIRICRREAPHQADQRESVGEEESLKEALA